MPVHRPLHRLPDAVRLELDEAAHVLAALDRAVDAGVPRDVQRWLISAVRMLTAKLWPELGRLLDDEEG